MVSLVSHRHAKNLCLHHIGAKIGVSESNVSQWLKDSRRVPWARLNALADALELELIPDSIQSDFLAFLKSRYPNTTSDDIRNLTSILSGEHLLLPGSEPDAIYE